MPEYDLADRLRIQVLAAENQARDRDDVIHEIAGHLRAALAVIDRYEDEIHRIAFDEQEGRA
jgi:hypothetical protein